MSVVKNVAFSYAYVMMAVYVSASASHRFFDSDVSGDFHAGKGRAWRRWLLSIPPDLLEVRGDRRVRAWGLSWRVARSGASTEVPPVRAIWLRSGSF